MAFFEKGNHVRRQRANVLVASILGSWKVPAYVSGHFRGCIWIPLWGVWICGTSEGARKHLHLCEPKDDERNRCTVTSSAAQTVIQNRAEAVKNHASRQTTSVYGFKGSDSFLWSIWAPMKNVLWLILLHPPCTAPNQASLPWGWTALFFTHMGIPQSRPLGNTAAAP